jgi:hypothetical protein
MEWVAYHGGEGVQKEDGEHGLGHHGEQHVIEVVYVAELSRPFGNS